MNNLATDRGLLFNSNSRYSDVDNKKIVFLTPKQVFDLDIGFDTSVFKPDELDDLFPFLVDTLENMVRETTLGDVNGSEIALPVENGDCKVFVCIEINGKLCKLQGEEWDVTNNFHGLPVFTQIKTFQRLLMEKQITLDDLAAEDIDNEVYKKLVVNDINGAQLCKEKIEKIREIYEKQCKDKTMTRKRERIINNM